ncbi:MAG: hypothetical protein Q4B79_02290 [Moraxella sp.]|uniref:hypothetical protein n=1 Tax=Moraxella sp. TaxID=479 RepID=UPI0026DD0B4D|nr:hypothetical protein [Moraxella sp.]MDO4449769.1 hypothetical protein [Moraxella sp.]
MKLDCLKRKELKALTHIQGGVFSVHDSIDIMLDCSLQDYRATSPLLSANLSEDEAFLVAGELLQLLKAYYKLYDDYYHLSSYQELNRIELIKNDSIFTKYMGEFEIENYTLHNAWNDSNVSSLIDKDDILRVFGFNALLYLSNKSIEEVVNDEKKFADVYILLKLVYFDNDWANLYKIYESLITFAESANYPNLEEFKTDKDKLTKPANNFSVVGLLSRHGVTTKKTDKKNCFSLDEAKDYVFSLVRTFLEWKYQLEIFENVVEKVIRTRYGVEQWVDFTTLYENIRINPEKCGFASAEDMFKHINSKHFELNDDKTQIRLLK